METISRKELRSVSCHPPNVEGAGWDQRRNPANDSWRDRPPEPGGVLTAATFPASAAAIPPTAGDAAVAAVAIPASPSAWPASEGPKLESFHQNWKPEPCICGAWTQPLRLR